MKLTSFGKVLIVWASVTLVHVAVIEFLLPDELLNPVYILLLINLAIAAWKFGEGVVTTYYHIDNGEFDNLLYSFILYLFILPFLVGKALKLLVTNMFEVQNG
jgi:hypothetical protein